MIRGTTPTLIFTIPYMAEQIEAGFITFAQRGSVCFEKELDDEDVEVSDHVIQVYLSQEETLMLSDVAKLKVQIRLRLAGEGDKAVASQIMETSVGAILKGGVI